MSPYGDVNLLLLEAHSVQCCASCGTTPAQHLLDAVAVAISLSVRISARVVAASVRHFLGPRIYAVLSNRCADAYPVFVWVRTLQSGLKKKGSFSFLGISLVLPDRHDRHCFYVRYHDRDGVHDLFFQRVDRDRNLWTDGLFEFIEKLREYIDKHPELITPQLPAAGNSKGAAGGGNDIVSPASKRREGDVGGSTTPRHSARGRSSQRKSSRDPSRGADENWRRERSRGDESKLQDKRRMLSPRRTAADESVRPRVSVLKNRMAQGLMYDGEGEGDLESAG